jgi:hypothetical protein
MTHTQFQSTGNMQHIKRPRAQGWRVCLAQFGRTIKGGAPQDFGLIKPSLREVGLQMSQGGPSRVQIELTDEYSPTYCVDNFDATVMSDE